MFPVVFEIRCPSSVMNPCTATLFGSSIPADISIAGQYRQWKRVMFFPITCAPAGHVFANRSGSSGNPAAVR